MKTRLRHIAFFFLTIFLVSQFLHVLHSNHHSAFSNQKSDLKISEHDFQQTHTETFKLSKTGHHHDCLICHHHSHNSNVLEVFDVVEFFFKALFYHKLNFNYFTAILFNKILFTSADLRGPPAIL